MVSDQIGEEKPGKRFSEAAFAEVTEAIRRTPETFKDRPIVQGITIDGPQSKDLDDALWLERDAHNGFNLLVSITDVASLVNPQMTPALDQEAFERAFTRYYAERNTPMLPRRLSENSLSLLEEQPRPAITLSIPFAARLIPGEPHIYQTRLQSSKRFTYEEVDEEIAHPQTRFAEMLQDIYQLAQGLLRARRAKGALAIYDINAGWATTEEGVLVRLDEHEKNKAHIIIQECMILANQTMARYLAQRDIVALYRNHTAKAIAPERFTLLKMIDAALAHPELASPERLRATTNLAMERAKYASTVEGHFGLNLPAYIHLTSPLRRYPDLVNQRILLASLQGQALPYTKEELDTIAVYVNEVSDAIKDARRAHFLAEHDEQLRQNIAQSTDAQSATTRPLESLDAKQFHSTLRIAAETHNLQPAIEQELLSRLDDEKQPLYAHDIFTLVFRFQNEGEDWDRVKMAVLHWVQRNPHHAISIFMMGRQALGWEEPQWMLSLTGPANQRRFNAQASVSIAGRLYTTSLQNAAQKDRARQLAIAELLVQIAGVSSVEQKDHDSTHDQTTDEHVSAQTELLQNYKGQLQELAQARKWLVPVYNERNRSGPPHAPTFIITCHLIINGQEYTAQGVASSKAKAEQLAAQNLFPLLPVVVESIAEAPVTTGKSALSILNEMVQKRAIENIAYTYQETGTSNGRTFTCTCVVTVAEHEEIVQIATGKNKKEATRQVAEQVLAALTTASNKLNEH